MWFTNIFYRNIIFRKSCGICHFCNTKRPSDITLGDFWGWEKTNPEANLDDRGISLLLINTQKGEEIFNEIKQSLEYFPVDLKNALQPNLIRPSEIHPLRDQFERDYVRKGFKYVYKKYSQVDPFIYRYARVLRRMGKRIYIKLTGWLTK